MNDSPRARGGLGRVWLDRGVAAARAGRKGEAREALFRALNDESQREMAWLWLAAVSDDPRQERSYLEKVLSLNPHNEHARKGIAYLDKADHEEPVTGSTSDEEASDKSGGGPSQYAVEVVVEAEDNPDAAALDEAAALAEKPVDQLEPPPEKTEAAGTEVVESDERRSVPVGSGVQPVEIEGFGDEPTGWTTGVPLVESPASVAVPLRGESSYWAEAAPSVPADTTTSGPRRPVRRRESRPIQRRDMPRRSRGPAAKIADEAFKSHEMWAVLASTVGLILLAIILAFFFALSLLLGS